MKKWILLLIFVLGVGGAFLATKYSIIFRFYPPQGRHSGSASCAVSCCLPDTIKLTPGKKAQVQKMQKNYCQCMDTLALQIDRKRLTLGEMLLQSKPDSSAIENLLNEIAHFQAAMEKQTINHILEVKNLLPSEQQDRFIKPILHEIQRGCQHEEAVKNPW
jgi:hypothetical protein